MDLNSSLESPIRLIKGLLAFCVAMGTVLIMMPLTSSIITSNTTAGSVWPVVATMALWAFYLVAIIGAPLLVIMGRGTVLGTLEASVELLIGTIGAVIILPFIDATATMLLSDFWLFGAQIAMWIGFLVCMIIIPLFTLIKEENEVPIPTGGE